VAVTELGLLQALEDTDRAIIEAKAAASADSEKHRKALEKLTKQQGQVLASLDRETNEDTLDSLRCELEAVDRSIGDEKSARAADSRKHGKALKELDKSHQAVLDKLDKLRDGQLLDMGHAEEADPS
jgi:hypothetical protein